MHSSQNLNLQQLQEESNGKFLVLILQALFQYFTRELSIFCYKNSVLCICVWAFQRIIPGFILLKTGTLLTTQILPFYISLLVFFAFLQVCVCTRKCVRTHANVYELTQMCTHVRKCACTHANVYEHTQMCTRMCTNTRKCVHTHANVYTRRAAVV